MWQKMSLNNSFKVNVMHMTGIGTKGGIKMGFEWIGLFAILLYIAFFAAGAVVAYFVIRIAVKHGVRDAQHELKKQPPGV